ncbi:MAG: isoprenylcysteine carboxylmethyltransferase family protein [Firmicutes bacterium]|nr:isoprenylcysteine carboxylmethyltransferase family protein [Bacillota bacterium]
MKLLLSALEKYVMGLLFMAVLVFWPAGSLRFWNGWLMIGLLFIPMLILGIVLFIKAPELLKKRLNAKEKSADQQGVVAVSGLMFLVGFIVAGLDHRLSWSTMPDWVVIAASAVFLISYALYAEVMRENAYLSRTIEVQEGQRVIDTGLYGVVRHPMYAVTLWLFLAIPLILGSWYALILFVVYPAVIAVRIRGEEKLLEEELSGYKEYRKKVKYRMIPFIW